MKYSVLGALSILLLLGVQPAVAQVEPEPLNVFRGEIPQAENVFYVATDGDDTNSGTEEAPFASIEHAIGQVSRGDVIVLRGGIYHRTETVRIQTPSGFTDEMITLTAYPGEVPIFDFSEQPKERNLHGFRINANFWHVIGITVRNASHNGIRMDGSFNILEQITTSGNHDTGLHMAGWASNNLILNSDSFHNFNYDVNRTPRIGNNADGFGAKTQIGPNNRYVGCRAWENSDDGFDFWEAPNTIIVENSWAFGNGDASVFGNPANFEGNGNGFKLGGNHVHTPHVVRRSVAFENFGASGNAKGFDFNNNHGAMTLEHNTAYNNGRNYWFPADPPGGGQPVFLNNASYVSNQIPIIPPSAVLAGNSWQAPVEVTSDDFSSLDTGAAKGPREADGSLPNIALLRPAPGSLLVDGGVAFGNPFYGSAPDIGAFELPVGDLVNPWLDRGTSARIASLRVYDMEAGVDWSIQNHIGMGHDVYGDDDVVLSAISGDVVIDEWIQTAAASSTKNYLFTTAEVTFVEQTMVLVAHSDAVSTKPSWLSSFEPTDAQIVISDDGVDHFMTIYRRIADAGETVTLGRNTIDGATDVPMYLAMVGTVTLTSSETLPALAGGFRLHQNYPNPFQGETTFSFTLEQPSQVTMAVYDVTGREVAHVADGQFSAGDHAVRWRPQSLASGVYFVRMTSNNITETRRIVLVRQ